MARNMSMRNVEGTKHDVSGLQRRTALRHKGIAAGDAGKSCQRIATHQNSRPKEVHGYNDSAMFLWRTCDSVISITGLSCKISTLHGTSLVYQPMKGASNGLLSNPPEVSGRRSKS